MFSTTWPAMNQGFEYHDTVRKHDDGITVEHFYQQHYASSGDEKRWLERIDNGQITYRHTSIPLQRGTVLRASDKLTYFRVPSTEPDAPAYFHVLYEDEHVLALCKPAGLQVLPKGLFLQRTVLGLLQLYMEKHRRQRYPGSLDPVPVHRLGRGTSGVLLCACTAVARQRLARDFKTETELGAGSSSASAAVVLAAGGERRVGKRYRALVTGIVEQDQFEVHVPIGLVDHLGLSSGLFAASPSGKPAHSICKVLHRNTATDSTLVEVTILTGRPHQIRIHMAAVGHPLTGDPLYGPGGVPSADILSAGRRGALNDADTVMPGDCGYHLHSLDLSFIHPATGEKLVVTAPIPPELQLPNGS